MKGVGGRTLCLLLLAGLAACCLGEHAAAPIPSDQVKVDVGTVGFDRISGTHVVVLEDHAQKRQLPILIGDNEAQAIMLQLHGIKPERPLTHDLLLDVIRETGNHVDRVLISDMHNEIYYAKIFMDQGRYSIDSRPSDAIAVAMGVNAPIYVTDRLFESAPPTGGFQNPAQPELARGLGITVERMTPELARYFGAPEGRGVLVSEVDAAANKAGVERGDIILKVGTREVKEPDDFRHGITASKGGESVVLALRRNGADRTVTIASPASSAQQH